MAKEHLRESCIFQNSDFSIVDGKQYPQKLTESTLNIFTVDSVITKALKLKESLSNDNDKQILNEVIKKLSEAGASTEKKTWKLPIGRYENLNGNKRIYPKKLWENVRDRQQDTWKGIAGLMDHPEADDDPGMARDQAVVWLDMQIGDDGIVYGIGRFVGPYGQLAQEIIECGGRCGFSSSGFGDVDKYTKIVDPETYIIERLADIVINPSQGVYGSADCTHTASEFVKDVHKGATIEFDKQTLKEGGISKIAQKIKENNMADQTNQTAAPAQAAAQPQQPQQVDAAKQQPAAPAPSPQATATQPTNGTQPQQRDGKLSETLTKVEEKAFRKYVNAFIEDASKIENPIHRLNECTEILGYFESGACPDLREKLEEQLIEEKAKLEKLIESTVDIEKDFGIDVATLRENALKITTQATILNEQVDDYKALCEELTKRNQKLLEDNKNLYKQVMISKKLTEKTEVVKNKELTSTNSELETLKEKLDDMIGKNRKLAERVSELSLSNKALEKQVGTTSTKLREAAQLLMKSKNVRKDANSALDQLEKENKSLLGQLQETKELYGVSTGRIKKLQETVSQLQKEIDYNNPQTHVIPKFEDRVGKFLNLRENKGADVEAYWSDLVDTYGIERVEPFERQLREAKSLKEATSNFLRLRTQIDPDFAIAQPINQYAYRNRSERQALMESQGIPIPNLEDATTEQLNADFAQRMANAGLR
jgi:hypothetical protein